MATLKELYETPTEGHDCTDYVVIVDIGSAPQRPEVDDLFVDYDHDAKQAFIKRRRALINP